MSILVDGILKSSAGNVIGNADIVLTAISTSLVVLGGTPLSIKTDADGRYSFTLHNGNYAVSVSRDGNNWFSGMITVTDLTVPKSINALLLQDAMMAEIPADYWSYFQAQTGILFTSFGKIDEAVTITTDSRNVAVIARDEAVAARDIAKESSENAQNIADANTFYVTPSDPDGTIAGIAGTPVGKIFRVGLGSGRGFKFYRNDNGTAVEIAGVFGSDEFNSVKSDVVRISGDNPVEVPQVFESLDETIPQAIILTPDRQILAQFPDPRIPALELTSVKSNFYETLDQVSDGEFLVVDNAGLIIGRLAPSSVIYEVADLSDKTLQLQSTSVKSGVFETLDPSDEILILDAAGRILGKVAPIDKLEAELEAASGSQEELSTRLNNGLTPFGDARGPYASRWSVREVRMRLEKLAGGDSTQLTIGLLGDSYSNDKSYYSMQFAKQLQDQYGMAGVGWFGFGWYGPASGTWTSTVQPVGISGSIRTDLAPICQVIGTWTCTYGAPSTNAPALYKITSSTADDYVRFTVPPAGGAYSNSCRLFYSGDGSGVVQVSWDDGATWSGNINLATVGAGNINLAGTPSAGGIARIKVVSGNVGLAGVDLQSTAPGVRIHKLGCSGSTAAQWAGVGAQWQNQMTALSCKCHQIMLGTNDQGVATSPSVFTGHLATIFANLDAILPYSDKTLVMPAENQRTTNAYKMPAYAQMAREFAIINDIGYCDLQPFFGSPENYAFAYAYANPERRWYSSDLIHPDGLTGGRAIASALNRFYTQF
ncbi:Prophage tail fibre N-terminal [Serratia fonticola]|uniref:prophage tail fiber N-terminal domain-containing protein n=1 Tax=Serratia fonticola TaxID=47917 RepID=UPI00217A1439|nr:prophage tail fiber N-terminal domain-containing protein [Serratia fonticola]CAI0694528.1 Prophage tail fibre N-terminal [Serratia fonticola]